MPEPLVKAVSWDTPRKGFSVTDLIQPPQITQLTRRHWDEIEIDASERIWVLLGSAIHYILEKGKVPESQREQILRAEIDGLTITGRVDLSHQLKTSDYKVTSVWSQVFEPEGRKDWHAQLNLYRWLRLKNSLPTDKLEVCAILRDWQQSKSNDEDYPKVPVSVIPVPVWPDEKVESYLKDRIRMHLEAQTLSDGDLPLCTDEDMWSKPTTYAVMKPGRKTAVKVCVSMEDAVSILEPPEFIVTRPGKRTRCEGYCDVAPFCTQFKKYKEAK